MERLEKARRLLEKHHQEHLLAKYDELDSPSQKQLLDSIESIDFDLMDRLFQETQEVRTSAEDQMKIEPIYHISKDLLTKGENAMYRVRGEMEIKEGHVAVVTMAGGQGTRLGFNGPKGAFIFDPENGKSIFEALTDTLRKICKRYKVNIPWYIMTSRENDEATKAFFKEHHNFDYPGDIIFFTQGELPMLDMEGKILLDRNYQIKLAANGHGGTLHSMEEKGVIDDMKSRGIKWISINGVDNVLVQPVDPVFIGLAVRFHSMGAVKSIEKEYPEERVGVLCLKNGKVGVVEYTEISEEMANMLDCNGFLLYGDAYALFNLYSMEGLELVSKLKLPYHIAVKKADYVDSKGNFVVADKPNSYKFEQFIFDAYELFDNVTVLRVKREDEFAPIKNASGQDSPKTALALYKAYKRKKN